MSERARAPYQPPRQAEADAEYISPSIRRRRAAAAAARRRRLLIIDLALGLAIALFLLIASPGLAIVAVMLIVAVLALLASAAFRLIRRRRAARGTAGKPRRADGPRPGPEHHG